MFCYISYCKYSFIFTNILVIAFVFVFCIFFVSSEFLNINAQEKEENKKIHEVIIPKGSANPSIDITNLEERKWYIPPGLEINSGEIVKWINNDVESHTVTSGVGSGIASLLTNQMGKPNGLFDSGLISSGKSWQYDFSNKKGFFSYFCTIHPWMTGSIHVIGQIIKPANLFQNIPDYPVDGTGNKVSRFPVHTLTNDKKYDIDLGWSPRVLITHNMSTFFIDFFDMPSNKRSHLLPFDAVIIQNNKTLARTSAISQVGFATLEYIFSDPGPVTIRIENVGNNPSYTVFNTTVYQNPHITDIQSMNPEMQHDVILNPAGEFSLGILSPIFLVQLTYVIIFAIPAAVGVIIFLYKKGII